MVLLTGGTVVLALVVRQGIMLLDNITLTQELAQKENHFRSLVQGSSDVIMIAAPSGVLRYVSPAAAGVYGRSAEELVGTELANLIHPEDLGCVVHEVRRFLAANPVEEPTTRIECRFRSGDGGWLNVESTVNRHHGGLIFNSRDVTERVRLQAQLQHNAEHDPLTDLPNRALFTKHVQHALWGPRLRPAWNTAVLFIDLDGLRPSTTPSVTRPGTNCSSRPPEGPGLRPARRHRLTARRRQVRGPDRRGQHPDRDARERHILELADRLRTTLSQPYLIDGNDVRVNASIGVAFAESGLGTGELLRDADLAMYRAEAGGKDTSSCTSRRCSRTSSARPNSPPVCGPPCTTGSSPCCTSRWSSLEDGRIASVSAQARWRSSQGCSSPRRSSCGWPRTATRPPSWAAG